MLTIEEIRDRLVDIVLGEDGCTVGWLMALRLWPSFGLSREEFKNLLQTMINQGVFVEKRWGRVRSIRFAGGGS